MLFFSLFFLSNWPQGEGEISIKIFIFPHLSLSLSLPPQNDTHKKQSKEKGMLGQELELGKPNYSFVL